MSLPRYPKYKDSGVEWLGKVPEHWEVQPLFGVASERNESNLGMHEDNLLSLSYGRIVLKDIESNDGLLPESFETYQIVHPGDMIFRLTDLQNDKRSLRTGIVEQRGIITSAYLAVSPINVQPQFFNHLLRAYDVTKVFYSMGGGLRQSMKFSDVKRLPILVPPPVEQIGIATFLKRETGKIDALVEEQRRLIGLLKEKRQAVISHAVTKGLSPDAPMKDSGIRWIGSVPSDWNISRVKYEVTEIADCLHTTPTYEGEVLYPAIRTADIEPGRILLDQARLVSEEVYQDRVQRLEPKAGDILYSREGERFGIAALVPPKTKLCLGQRMMMFRPKAKNSSAFLMWTLNSACVYQQVVEGITGPTAPHVNIGDVVNFRIPLPNRAEQEKVGDHINLLTGRADELISIAEKGIVLLQERRTALISAAVTGKIDLRGLAAEDAA